MNAFHRVCLSAAVALLAYAASLAPARAQLLDIGLYGHLDQYSMNAPHNFVGNEACFPTSSTNALTYLQNAYPGLYGTSLSGANYAVAMTVIPDPGTMGLLALGMGLLVLSSRLKARSSKGS
jgi:hypothetical protein